MMRGLGSRYTLGQVVGMWLRARRLAAIREVQDVDAFVAAIRKSVLP